MILDAAARCDASCRVDILTSPRDYAEPSAREFATFAADLPRLEVRVHSRDYGKHGAVGGAFYPFLRELVE